MIAYLPIGEDGLVDTSVLERLSREIDVTGTQTARFVQRFISLWPDRRDAIRVTVAGRDRQRAIEATLSLKTTAEMLGAIPLFELSLSIERSIRLGDWDAAQQRMAMVDELGTRTNAVLAEWAGGRL